MIKKKRIMALDVGDKTIGIALTDELQITAQGLETYKRIGIKKDTDYYLYEDHLEDSDPELE